MKDLVEAHTRYNVLIEWDADPSSRPDAVGLAGATQYAQLCAGGVIAAKPTLYAMHAIVHEMGHAIVGNFYDEAAVAREQIAFLEHVVRILI